MVVFASNKSSDKTFSNMSEEDKDDSRTFSDDDENWTKLQDIASRRRIQNRISQRKRRRRLRENSLNRRQTSTSPPSKSAAKYTTTDSIINTTTTKNRPEIERNKSEFLDCPHLNSTTRSRSISDISEFSLDGSALHQRQASISDKEQILPTTPNANAFNGSWDQQFFDQAFMSEIQGFEGGTADFLYTVPGLFASPAYPPSNLSPSLSYSSDGSMDNSCLDPKLKYDYDDMFNPSLTNFTGNDLCMTPPRFDFTPSPMPQKAFPAFVNAAGYPTPPASLHSHHSSLQSTPDLSNNTFTDVSGNTALHLAAEKGHMGIVQLLLDTGIDINARNNEGLTALHISLSASNLPMTSLLLEKNAGADQKNALGQNGLHIAVEKGNTALVQLVLDYLTREDIEARDCLGQTAFHRAVAMGWEEIVRVMLLRGCDSRAMVGGSAVPQQ